MSLRDMILDKYAPSGVQVVQWLQGRPTRDEVLNYLQYTVDELNNIKKFISETMEKFDKKTVQTFSAMRLQSHQIDTLVRLTTGGSSEARQKFYHELRRTMTFAEFVDSLTSKRGAHYEKPMREKVEMLRSWNKQDDVILCDFDLLQLQAYITDFPAEFSKAEIADLEKEFNFQMGTPSSNIIIGDEVHIEKLP